MSLVLLIEWTSTWQYRNRIILHRVTLMYDTNIKLQRSHDEPCRPLALFRSTQAYTILRVLQTLPVLQKRSLVSRVCAKSHVLLNKFELYWMYGLKWVNVDWNRIRRTALRINNQQKFLSKSGDQEFTATSSFHHSEFLVFTVWSDPTTSLPFSPVQASGQCLGGLQKASD